MKVKRAAEGELKGWSLMLYNCPAPERQLQRNTILLLRLTLLNPTTLIRAFTKAQIQISHISLTPGYTL